MSQTFLEPKVVPDDLTEGRWMALIFNDDKILYDDVVRVLVAATACDIEEAQMETWEAHTFGKAPFHFANRTECERAAAIVARIGVETKVQREWAEA